MKLNLFTERGQALILIALAGIALFGIAGLAIDGSAKFSDRRHAQNAADTAALAGALTLARSGDGSTCSTSVGYSNSVVCSDVIGDAWDRAQENGYDGMLSSDVEVYSPPISGTFSDCNDVHFDCKDYVQVIITSHIDTWFMRVLGFQQTTNVVSAVASKISAYNNFNFGGNAIVALSPDGCALKASGTTNVVVNGGGMYSNSDEFCSFQKTTCSGSIDVNDENGNTGIITMVGGVHLNTNCWDSSKALLDVGGSKQQPFPPPYAEIPEPAECSTNGTKTNNNSANTTTLTPGYFDTLPPSGQTKKTVYLTPGIYCVGSTMSTSGLDNFTILPPATFGDTNGVFIYIKPGGSFTMNSTTNIQLWGIRDVDSPYFGYLVYVAPDYSLENPSLCKINGSSISKFQGTFYAPYCDMNVNGGSGMTLEAQIIGYTVDLTGASGVTLTYNANSNPTWDIPLQVGLSK